MKLQKLFCATWNKKTNQMSLHLRAEVLKMEGLTPQQLWMNGKIDWPVPTKPVTKLK